MADIDAESYNDPNEPCPICKAIKDVLESGLPFMQSEHFLVLTDYGDLGHALVVNKEHGELPLDADLTREIRRMMVPIHGDCVPSSLYWPSVATYRADGPLSEHQRFLWLTVEDHKTVPQAIADAQTDILEEAIQWFRSPHHLFLGDPTVRRIPDDEVRRRILAWQIVLDKEVARYTTGIVDTICRFERNVDEAWHRRFLTRYTLWLEEEMAGPAKKEPMLRYDLRDLPFPRQRAIIERMERVWNDWLAAHPDVVIGGHGFHERFDDDGLAEA